MPKNFEFDDSSSGVRVGNLTATSREVDFFNVFWTNSLVDTIVEESNRFFYFMQAGKVMHEKSRDRQWTNVTSCDMRLFLALSILMGIVRKRSYEAYWTTDPLLSTPIFSKVMSRNRFALILRSLHFCDNLKGYLESVTSKIKKIESVYECLRKSFRESFYPYQNVVIDESLVLWRGNLSFRQYIPSKRHRFGIKLFVMCDCKTGYVQDLILYTGATTLADYDAELGLSGSIVKTFMEPYLDRNHVLFVDNWYTSPKLLQYLFNRSTGGCGTVRRNRKKMPPVAAMKERGTVVFSSANNILATFWMDKREVALLSTIHVPRMVLSDNIDPRTRERVMKPECVVDYNINMRLVDKSDAMISSIECTRKTLKWYKRFFFHLVDMSMLNAHVLFMATTNKKCTLPDFVIEVVRDIFEDNAEEKQAPGRRAAAADDPLRLTARHFCRPMPVPAGAKKGRVQRACHVCKHTSRKESVRRDTRFHCHQCDVPLCVDPCFEEYHILKKY